MHTFVGAIDEPVSKSGGAETGFSDIILRTKYNFIRGHAALPDMAVTAQLTLPTGDEDNLLGTGHAKMRGQFIASKKFGDLTPHLNVGCEETTGIDRFANLT
ncbi:MAG: hypothetical protein ACI915_004064 [Gammaproteobacteria bacterium]